MLCFLHFYCDVHALRIDGKGMYFQDSTIAQKLKKGGFLKKLFHHSDSSKLAKKFIHQQHKLLHNKKVPRPAVGVIHPKNSFFNPGENFQLGYEVFGWYPHWEEDFYKHINFSLLSTVAYFSYEVNPKTGEATATHDWETTALIDTVRTYSNKRILLTVSNFGAENNRKLLGNTKAINTLITNLITLISKRKGNGVCVDFEGIAKKEKSDFVSFVSLLSSRLKKANTNYKVYVTLPSVDFQGSIDGKALNQVVDRFVVMGYDYYGSFSTVAGPNAPLESGKVWEPFNLEKSVDTYLKSGIPAAKLLLALPTYGNLWETESASLPSKVKHYISSVTYGYVKSEIEKNGATRLDPISKSARVSYLTKDNTYRQCWFENDSSFTYKTRLVKEKKLAGIGLWALGYSKGYDDLWKVISTELSQNAQGESSTADEESGDASTDSLDQLEEKLAAITQYETIFLYIMMFTLFFAGIGFLAALCFPNTRAALFNNASLKLYYMVFMLLLAVVIFRKIQWINDGTVLLMLGFGIGAFAFYLSNKIVEQRKRDLP